MTIRVGRTYKLTNDQTLSTLTNQNNLEWNLEFNIRYRTLQTLYIPLNFTRSKWLEPLINNTWESCKYFGKSQLLSLVLCSSSLIPFCVIYLNLMSFWDHQLTKLTEVELPRAIECVWPTTRPQLYTVVYFVLTGLSFLSTLYGVNSPAVH